LSDLEIDINSILENIKNDTINVDLKSFDLGDKFGVCMVDVNSGSDTRVLVKKVLDWDQK
jgi:phosphomevalonate kinase